MSVIEQIYLLLYFTLKWLLIFLLLFSCPSVYSFITLFTYKCFVSKWLCVLFPYFFVIHTSLKIYIRLPHSFLFRYQLLININICFVIHLMINKDSKMGDENVVTFRLHLINYLDELYQLCLPLYYTFNEKLQFYINLILYSIAMNYNLNEYLHNIFEILQK